MHKKKSQIKIDGSKKRFLLVYIAMYTGGIETLILRMTDWLIENGHEVDILLVKNKGELLTNINSKAKVISLGVFPELNFFLNFIFTIKNTNYDFIYSLSPVTIWMALLIGQKQRVKPIVLNGVYHLYDFKLFGNHYTKTLFDLILPDICKVFMTPYVKIEHEKILKRSIVNSFIWPLPIKTINSRIKRKPKLYKIVSIGRLAEFKTYNLYMIDIVRELINSNYPVEYFIYGDGELFDKIEKKIIDLDLKNNVHLCGTINYDKIIDVLADAYIFIGMGTSAIEAGMYKVPTIVAIAYSKDPITHGLVHELPDYNSGEFRDKDPVYNVIDLVKNLFEINIDEYNFICENTYLKLKKDYEINFLMKSFLKKLSDIKSANIVIDNIQIPYLYIIRRTLSKLLFLFKKFFKKLLVGLE